MDKINIYKMIKCKYLATDIIPYIEGYGYYNEQITEQQWKSLPSVYRNALGDVITNIIKPLSLYDHWSIRYFEPIYIKQFQKLKFHIYKGDKDMTLTYENYMTTTINLRLDDFIYNDTQDILTSLSLKDTFQDNNNEVSISNLICYYNILSMYMTMFNTEACISILEYQEHIYTFLNTNVLTITYITYEGFLVDK